MFLFDDKGIKNNQDLIKQAVANRKYKDWVADINGMARKFDIKNRSGFFISEIKKRLEETN